MPRQPLSSTVGQKPFKGKKMNEAKSDLDPWRIICGHLFEIDSYSIPELIDKTGMEVDWSLTDRQNYSHTYRKAAYRPRINSV